MTHEEKKFIDFIITQKCTYNCPYCSQSKMQTKCKNNASDETINAFYNFLEKIDNDFEITITGGEAFLHPKFFEIINKIKQKGFKINLISNLSFKIEQYQEIFDLLKNSLNRFDISLHIEQIQNFNLAIEKLEKFINLKPKTTQMTIFIPLYNINDKKELKIDKILRIAKKYNINYSFQKIRFLNEYQEIYEEKYISTHKKIKSFGKMCLAGCNSAIIYEDGSVYRCYSSRFSHSDYLGNINDFDFALNKCAQVCSKSCCGCPKPLAYNQITNEEDFKSALINKGKNILYLPKMIILKRKIVLQKIRQFFKLLKS